MYHRYHSLVVCLTDSPAKFAPNDLAKLFTILEPIFTPDLTALTGIK